MKGFLFIKSKCYAVLCSCVMFLVLVFTSNTALAHRVVIFAWIEGDTVYTESQFPDGKKISDAAVKVYDSESNLLLEGKTNDNGEFSFKIPKISALKIVLEAGMGHRGQWQLTEAEIKSAMGVVSDTPATEIAADLQDSTSHSVPAENSQIPESGGMINEKQLEQIIEKTVEKALDKKIHPIYQILAQMQDTGPSAKDIFGGIGYILGLMGVAAYFLSRKQR